MDTKVTSIVAYISWIGLIIALVAGDKEGAKFHINQALVIMLFSLVSLLSFIPVVGILTGIWSIFMMICWILGLVAAIKQEEKEVPLIGKIRILK
ncbi:MAG: hypothetical protein K2H52_11440 [Lachnospiraceae bacterium]|nr:hypothetical protein [Lachnospiraceae bacterium]MDE7285808.1 hypothetical protein [Lachnospiraceae bacterium]